MGLFTAGPDINISKHRYYGISNEMPELNHGIYKGTVVIGIMAVKGLSVSGINQILGDREKRGPFKNLDDFSRRIRLNRDDIISLCPAGVFDSIAGDLPRDLQARFLLSALTVKTNTEQSDLFSDDVHTGKKITNKAVSVLYKNPRFLQEEYLSLGFLRNAHPLVLWSDKIIALESTILKNRVKAIHIARYSGSYVKMIGWQVTQKEVWTKDGLTMSFLSLEDETAMYETVVFPQIYGRYSNLLFDQHPLIISGLVTADNGAITLEVNKIEKIN
jgi:DNA polymerase-3 subunit alpha/error-prone DNA polymerase